MTSSLILAVVLVVAAAAVYWFMVRPVLAQWAAFRSFYNVLNEVEATFWFKLSMWFKGLKGLLMSWATIIAPIVLAVLQFFQVVDITTMLPEKYRPMWPVVVSAIGFIFLRINAVTDTPQGSPVAAVDAVVEVPTVAGKPDAAVATMGTDVIATAPTRKAPDAIMATETEPVRVEEVIKAAETGAAVVIKAKKEWTAEK